MSYKGKWSLSPVWQREREKRRLYVTAEVTTFRSVRANGVEVSSGQEVELALAGACVALEGLEPCRKTDG